MQAIITKFIAPTNTRGSRYKASCERGSLTVDADHALSAEENHRAVCDALCSRFDADDAARYGTASRRAGSIGHTWCRPKASGQLPSGEYVFCFIPERFFERKGAKL